MLTSQLYQSLKSTFPTDATCWSQATDEIVEMAINAYDVLLPSCDPDKFTRCNDNPSKWNKQAMLYIITAYDVMTDQQRSSFIDHTTHLFNYHHHEFC